MLRVPTAAGPAYFKACAPVQAFEPRLTAVLAGRWPDRLPEVLAADAGRAWLLTADAGLAIRDIGNDPAAWERLLAGYAELQRAEAGHAADHLAHGVPDLRTATLPARYGEMASGDLPLPAPEVAELRSLAPRLARLCELLLAGPVPDTIQHADLHPGSVFARGDRLRIIDWGDASIGHPFFSLGVTFKWLRDVNGLAPGDPWFARLRDAYLEPWGSGLAPLLEIAQRAATVAHALGWLRHHRVMAKGSWQPFEEQLPNVLRGAIHGLRTTLPA